VTVLTAAVNTALCCYLTVLFCVSGDDISKPLKHSFIHTGHADATGKLWGDPGQIDEYVLYHLSYFVIFIHTLFVNVKCILLFDMSEQINIIISVIYSVLISEVKLHL